MFVEVFCNSQVKGEVNLHKLHSCSNGKGFETEHTCIVLTMLTCMVVAVAMCGTSSVADVAVEHALK
jgi:hypothetical protein